jgi:hypothetical protein
MLTEGGLTHVASLLGLRKASCLLKRGAVLPRELLKSSLLLRVCCAWCGWATFFGPWRCVAELSKRMIVEYIEIIDRDGAYIESVKIWVALTI